MYVYDADTKYCKGNVLLLRRIELWWAAYFNYFHLGA